MKKFSSRQLFHLYALTIRLAGPILLAVLLMIMMWAVQSAQAQVQTVEYEGLDIVFIIDQSSSMQRADGSNPPNDPDGLRFYAPWYAMYWLGEDRLLVHQDITFRMALVNFGSGVEVWDFGNGRYWQEIEPASRAAWEPVYGELTQDIQGNMRNRFLDESLGATNFLNPFETAETLFNQLPEDEGERRRVIIVLTDGQPSGPVNGPVIHTETHMTALQEYAAQHFTEPDYLIYIISMIDASQAYWDDVEPFWEAITNDPCTDTACPDPKLDRASIVASDNDVGRRFQEILQVLVRDFPKPADLIVVESDVIPGPLVVPPYLKSIDFTYFKANPIERLILTNPEGNETSELLPNVTIEGENGPIEAVRIANPLPGKWFVSTDPPNTDVDITMRQIFATSRLDSPNGPQVQFLPVTIQYTLLDDLGQNLPFYTDVRYRLLVEATITADGESWPVPLSEEQGHVYRADFTPVLAASHTISVHAESQDLEGNPIVVFHGEIGSFEVEPAVLAPLSLPGTMQQYDETTFAFELQDTRGFPVKSAAPIDVTVTIEGEAGAPLNLTQQQDGTYQVIYSPQQDGQHSASVIATVADDAGNVFEIANEELGSFDVIPTVRVGIDLVEPQEPEQSNTTLWPFNRNPLIVAVEVRDENKNLVAPSQVFAGDPAEALQLTLIDEEGNDLSEVITLTLTAETGMYRAETLDVGRGDYTIRVDAVGDLQTGYLYENNVASFDLTRIRHPLHIPILISTLLAVVAGTAVAYVAVKRYRNITQHPCTGRLYVVDSASVPLYQVGLDGYNRNRIILKSGFNPLTRITKIELNCHSEADNQNGRVQVQVWTDKNKTPIVDRSLGKKGEVKLGKLSFWLLKDPTEEQLSRDRFGMVGSKSN